jgi:threonine dehydrogenase-like Zn-dependent dehydrogenase
MKAAVFDGPGRPLTIDDVADPVPGPGDLVLRVMACGICGSDLHLADVADTSAGVHALPSGAVMGHEFSGEVVAAGSDVRAVWEIGARHVIVSDLVPARLERAAQIGATATIDASREDVVERLKAIAGERPEVIVECVGVRGTQQLAMDYAPTNGRIVIAGVCMEPDRILPVKAITKELQVNYVIGYRRRDFAFTVDMLAAGRIDSRPMISGAVGFDTFPAAFEALKHSKTDCKVLLEPQR